MNNIFIPYIVVEDNDNTIHLAVSRSRKILFAFTFYLIPIIILCLIPLVLYYTSGDAHFPFIPIGLLMITATGLAIMLLFKTLIHEVVINSGSIRVTTVRRLKKNVRDLLLQDADHIYLEVYRGRGGGAFFRLVMKDNAKVEFINIPWLFMKSENTRQICVRLKKITGLPISGDSLAIEIIENIQNDHYEIPGNHTAGSN